MTKIIPTTKLNRLLQDQDNIKQQELQDIPTTEAGKVLEKEIIEALERVLNQIGGGYSEEFYKDLANIKAWINIVKS